MAFLKGTKIYSIVSGKCPVCHIGKMYENKNAYRIRETLKMHERCPYCETKFKIEPSFFYGAMYVSYGVGIVFAAATFAVTYFWLHWNRFNVFISIIVTLVALLPIILRLSRNIWINLFFKYNRQER